MTGRQARQVSQMTDEEIIARALSILESRARHRDCLSSPNAVRDYLRLSLSGRDREAFCVVFLDAQHRVLAIEELFQCTLTQTSVYPRAVVKREMGRRPKQNPLTLFRERFPVDAAWLAERDLSAFHLYAFATLRQLGACSELTTNVCGTSRGPYTNAPA